VNREKIMGAFQVQGIYRDGFFYHYHCIPVARDWRTNREEESKVLKGNLEPEEYRFWIGSKESYTTYAMCRCCRTSVYSSIDRKAHLNDEKFAVAGDRCAIRLTKVYAILLEWQVCLVCKKQRFNNKKWGVPLCDRSECHMEWKFGQAKFVAVESLLNQQLKKAEFLAREKVGKTSTSFAIQESKGVTVFRPWCKVCQMYSDNAAHSEIHAAALIEGKIISD
jgi:hypothetical protein